MVGTLFRPKDAFKCLSGWCVCAFPSILQHSKRLAASNRMQHSEGHAAKDSVLKLELQRVGHIDPVRLKLASLALTGTAANSTTPGEQIKAAWPGTARHGHQQLPQPATPTAFLAPRGPPRPYKTFSNASQDLSRGEAGPILANLDCHFRASCQGGYLRPSAHNKQVFVAVPP